MNPKHSIILKPGREHPVLRRHHWIFSGGIAQSPNYSEGDILPVLDSRGNLLGHGYFNHKGDIAGRMVSFGDADPWEYLQQQITAAWQLRQMWFKESQTNSYRVVNGEGDGVPGLIVDRYADTLVIQSSTSGMDKLKVRVVDLLVDLINPKTVWERSDIGARNKENLPMINQKIYGDDNAEVEILENGIKFKIDVKEGHKTGFYLDMREMRALIGDISSKRRVLNCFSYNGGFSLYAARGGAHTTTSVDISEAAINAAKHNFELNNLAGEHRFIAADVFKFLREDELNYDLIILDPPAFAKKKSDVPAATRGYRDINRLALSKMPAGSLLLTCSCSYHVDVELFEKIVLQAAAETGRSMRVIQRHRLAPDHALNIYHQEADYLKSLLIWVD
jgi:23S rRNA (cytosine1962-C5)-methyltransferase